MDRIQFSAADKAFSFPKKKLLKQWIESCFRKEGKKIATIHYIFCSDDFLLDINKKFLNHDYYTDIITFDLSEPPEAIITAEIYISLDRVKENAQQLHTPYKKELLRVLIHGALHLCGHKDKLKKEVAEMRAAEEQQILNYYQLERALKK